MITQGMTTVMGTIELKASLKENVCVCMFPSVWKKCLFIEYLSDKEGYFDLKFCKLTSVVSVVTSVFILGGVLVFWVFFVFFHRKPLALPSLWTFYSKYYYFNVLFLFYLIVTKKSTLSKNVCDNRNIFKMISIIKSNLLALHIITFFG